MPRALGDPIAMYLINCKGYLLLWTGKMLMQNSSLLLLDAPWTLYMQYNNIDGYELGFPRHIFLNTILAQIRRGSLPPFPRPPLQNRVWQWRGPFSMLIHSDENRNTNWALLSFSIRQSNQGRLSVLLWGGYSSLIFQMHIGYNILRLSLMFRAVQGHLSPSPWRWSGGTVNKDVNMPTVAEMKPMC